MSHYLKHNDNNLEFQIHLTIVIIISTDVIIMVNFHLLYVGPLFENLV